MVYPNYKRLIDVCLILAGIMIVLWPEADPSWLKSATDIHDAAWWADPAKQKIYHNTWMNGPFAGALAVGPLSVILHYLSFKALGISFFSMRLMSIVPALLMGIWMRCYGKEFDGRKAGILLISSTLCFTWARLGVAEIWMGFLLILAVTNLKKGTAQSSALAALLLFISFLIKASFVFQIFIVLPLIFELFKRENKKSIILFISSFVILGFIYYQFYLFENQELFSLFFQEFSNDYYSFQQLIDPAGLIARVVYLTDREFFKDPTVVLIVLVLLIKTAAGFSPTSRVSFSTLFLLGILFLLPSDFAGRRFVPLLPLLILAFVEPKSEKPISIYWQAITSVLLNWISFGILFPENSLFVFSNGFFQVKGTLYFIVFVQLVLLVIQFKFVSDFKASILNYLKYSVGVLTLSWVSLVLYSHFTENIWLIALFSIGISLVLYVLNSRIRYESLQFALIVSCGLLLNAYSFFSLSFSERDQALNFASKMDSQGGFVAGNSTSFSIALLSKSSAMHYPLSSNWNQIVPKAIAGYTSIGEDSTLLSQRFYQIETRYFKDQEMHCSPVQVWKTQQFGMICYPRREN